MSTLSDQHAPTVADRYIPGAIEKKWQDRWAADKLYETDVSDTEKEPYFFLTMYPYPSGDLHVGHWYATAPADAAARYKRMRGYNVLFPMGYDAFGLPAENAAVKAAQAGKSNVHPASLTYQRIDWMEKQFAQMGTMIDWSKRIVTCDPEYYKWNQWFFIKMYEKGLAYRKESIVNWDPVDQTVLANEQVIDGRGERSGALIERRSMPQWHFKITDYADELLDFSKIDWPERVVAMQTNWIGRSEGAEVIFTTEHGDPLEVFTTRPDTLWGATFMVLAPEHPLVEKLTSDEQRAEVAAYVEAASHKTELDRQAEEAGKTGVFTGGYAINPVNDQRIPIWIADYVLMGYGSGAIMAVPSGDERDFEFATRFGLPIVPTIEPDNDSAFDPNAPLDRAYTGTGTVINSGPLTGAHHNGEKGRESPAIAAAIDYLTEHNLGTAKVTYRLRDWLISRQRYWGTPIPMVYCEEHGLVPEKEENLPVLLPADVNFMPTGESPLKHHEGFLNATCPTCGGPARRETDTMDTFMDSSWYWFRYLSPDLHTAPFDQELVKRWTPVTMYTGGIEHAILHLLYARFFTKVLRDFGLVDIDEPFLTLRNQGMILGEDNEKMSKSRGNVVNPDPLVAEHGADVVRTYLMFIGPWDQGGAWSPTGIDGIHRFFNRVWTIATDRSSASPDVTDETRQELERAVHLAVKEITEDLDHFRFNTAIAELMTLVNQLSKARNAGAVGTGVWCDAIRTFTVLLAPFAPHLAEELWHIHGHTQSVHLEPWPTFDPEKLVLDTVSIAVQVNGRLRDTVDVAKDADQATLLAAAKASERVQRHLEGKEIMREIVVPGRLVNLVVKG